MEPSKLKHALREMIFESLEPETIFSTKLTDKNISFVDFQKSDIGIKYGINKHEDFEAVSELTVTWKLMIEARDTLIKSLDLIVENVNGIIVATPDPEFQPDNKIEIPFNSQELGFKIKNEMPITNGAAIYPDEIEIHFMDKTIIVK